MKQPGRPQQNTTDPTAIRKLAELERLAKVERALRAELDEVMGRRNELFRGLVELGVTYREVAGSSVVSANRVMRIVSDT